MTSEPLTLKFYKHSSDKEEFESNLQQTRSILKREMHERDSLYSKKGGFSGDLYVVHKNLWGFKNEASFLTQSINGDKQAQIYQVIINSTNGADQYLSTILRGTFDQKVLKQFEDGDFAPKHSYLTKEREQHNLSFVEGSLWLDDILEFNNPLSTLVNLEQVKN